MFGTIINCIKGSYIIKAEGRFPERILNIASSSKIYVHNIRRTGEDSLTFCVSKRGGDKLLESAPENLTLTLVESFGLPIVLQRYKKRVLLLVLPAIFLVAAFIFSLFIWRVEIEGGDKKLQAQVREVISENGIYIGAPKYKVDQYAIKRNAILALDEVSWLWVDIKGSSALVKVKERTPKPVMNEIHEPADVIATHSGVVEKMQVYCGHPLVSEGAWVEKGQVIITGVFRSENENIPTYYHHACGNVTLRLFEEKTVIIPKKAYTKTPTGKKKSVFALNLKKNNIKFSLNSGISYAEYDKIEKKYALPLLGLSFSKIDYLEVDVTSTDTDVEKMLESRKKAFTDSLLKNDMEIINLTEVVSEGEHEYTATFTAECLVRTDKEVPLEQAAEDFQSEKGETDGKNS